MVAWRGAVLAVKAAQALLLFVSLYQTAVTLAGVIVGRPRPRRLPADLPRFGLVVCARNEARVIAAIIDDFAAQHYPRDRYEVVVVAHNCTDETAAIAASRGVQVVELRTPRPGKAQAVAAGLQHLGDRVDFIGVFDADSRVKPTFLDAVARASRGEDCLQIESVPQRSRGWVGHGHGLDRRARNIFWWRPREALGLGTTINGSGFFVRPRLIRELLPELRTLTEDLELTAHLYASGHRIAFVSSTQIALQEPEKLRPMVKQRTRWARGHFGVIRHSWPAVAKRAIVHGDVRAADIAIYMITPSRVLTRTAVSFAFLLALLRLPFALPFRLVLLGMLGEWVLTGAIAFRERLVPRSRAGLLLAFRHGTLGLLWFPIGLWALLTPKIRSWDATPREDTLPEHEADAVATG
jgi:cellulose synthase/poly-beta-1,6-N-acetylglucosamine synthase-like glycosyltransferase